MKIVNITTDGDATGSTDPCVATIGFFDGVHRGHKHLIGLVKERAAASRLKTLAITFDRHPRQVLRSDYIPQLLSTLDSKLMMLATTGIDYVAVLHFDETMAAMSAYDFMDTILRRQLNVRELVMGYDNNFGHPAQRGKRSGSPVDDYATYGKELGIKVTRANALASDGVNVSSTVVRRLLGEGNIELANGYLGYHYTLAGQVVHGQENGRAMGFPTANLDTATYGQLVPAAGVYAVKARMEHSVAWWPAMCNIGTRPTFGDGQTTVEVNIFNYDGDLYGQTLLVSFAHRIREEQPFSSPEALAGQLARDKALVTQQFQTDYE